MFVAHKFLMSYDWSSVYWKEFSFTCEDLNRGSHMRPYDQSNHTKFSSIGHYVQASKAKLFEDDNAFASIMAASDAKIIVQLGYNVVGFDQSIWNKWRPSIIRSAIECFSGQKTRLNNSTHDWYENYITEHNKRADAIVSSIADWYHV